MFEYAEASLSPRTQAKADIHMTACPACRELLRQHRQAAQCLGEGFLMATTQVTFGAAEQRRLIAALRQLSDKSSDLHLFSRWWRRVAWISATAAIVCIGLLLISRLPLRDRPTHRASPDGPTLVRFSYCAPSYTFVQEDDFVIDSLVCTPRIIEQTLWNQPSPSRKPANQPAL